MRAVIVVMDINTPLGRSSQWFYDACRRSEIECDIVTAADLVRDEKPLQVIVDEAMAEVLKRDTDEMERVFLFGTPLNLPVGVPLTVTVRREGAIMRHEIRRRSAPQPKRQPWQSKRKGRSE